MRRHPLSRLPRCHQHGRRARVQSRARPGVKLVIHRLARDRMHKLKRTTPVQHVRVLERIRRRANLLDRQLANRRHMTNLRLRIEHGHRIRHRHRRRGQTRQTQQHRACHRLRPKPRHHLHRRRTRLHTIREQRVRQRPQQKRVAASRLNTRSRQPRIPSPAQPLCQQRRRRLKAKRPEPHQTRPSPLPQTPQQPSRLVGRRLTRPRGHHQPDRQLLQPRRQVVQKPQRHRIRPMRIIDKQHQAPPLCQTGRQPVQPVHDRKRRVRKPRRPATRPILPQHHTGQRRRATQQPVTVIGCHVLHRALEQLPRNAESELALQLLPRRPQNPTLVPPQTRACRPQQTRLPDPSMPLHKHQRPRPTHHRSQLGLPPI